MSTAVRLELEGYIAEITLNNPARQNALSAAVVTGLQEITARLAVSPGVRAVIVHGGQGKAFCAGADLKERESLDEAAVYTTVRQLRAAVEGLAALPVPVIAAIHGACFGGGLELALAADLRIASDDARLGLTEVAIGVVPGAGGTQRLPRLVGIGKAQELIYTAARLTAPEAAAIGLVNQVVAKEKLLAAARHLAQRIAEMAPLAVRAAKRAIGADPGLAAGLQAEWAAYETIIPTADRREGLAAFMEKRPPKFIGQ